MNKYRNKPTEVDGHRFDSQKEAHRYKVLKVLVASGAIADLELQPRFPLHAYGGTRVGTYVADFRYRMGQVVVVEDVKGMKTQLYKWKKKHFEAEYDQTIIEI